MIGSLPRRGLAALAAAIAIGCGRPGPASDEHARNLLLVTIDTLRADRVGAYGYAPARTPAMDRLAREGVRFTRAFTTAPITLPAHASLLSGRYPPGHRSRHNGVAMADTVPTIATTLSGAGFRTGAFVSAFPLDGRFGLARGFDVYDDELPRARDRRPLNERPGSETVTRAITWLTADASRPFLLWVHLFEPHAPYGDPESASPMGARYDEEIAAADRSVGRLLDALGDRAASTLVVVTADHGEAFGEHGEVGHSIFVYDTTLQVPLFLRGPGVEAGRTSDAVVSLVDVAPTSLDLLGQRSMDADGVSLVPVIGGDAAGDRAIYAESFAPLMDFGWSPLRSVRDGPWKYIAAPRPELYDVAGDPAESSNLAAQDPLRASRLQARVDAHSGLEARPSIVDLETANRLRSLGYLGGMANEWPAAARPDPKDRIQIASRLSAITSGELRGAARLQALAAIVRDDPDNPQARLRLGFAEIERGRCDRAEPHLSVALASGLPSADAGLGLAECRRQAGNLAGAGRALRAALALEPGNPVVEANLGLLALARDDLSDAIAWLRRALASDASLLEARFALARALGRAGRREEAADEARILLDQLPPDAPQRPEVQRLLDALR